MSGLMKVLNDSYALLLAEPKLFIPKFIVAALFSIPLLLFPGLALEALAIRSEEILVSTMWTLGVFIIASTLVDILVNAMYPFMVRDYFDKKPISLSASFRESIGKFFVVAPAVLAVELLTITIAAIASIPLAVAVVSGNIIFIAIAATVLLIVFFIVLVLFYLVYPVSALEKNHFIGALRQSVAISMKNRGDISKATLLTFAISLIAFVLAFAVTIYSKMGFVEGSIIALLLFLGVRLATAMLYTYQYVLNPVFYLEYEKNRVLK